MIQRAGKLPYRSISGIPLNQPETLPAQLCKSISNPEPFKLSDGEIYFLWWFIQGSIMSPMTRKRLWNGWGMCERHAWAFIAVEAAFRGDYLMGPAILYEDLMQRALASFFPRGLMKLVRIKRGLYEKGPKKRPLNF
jgi:hypothetical protein